MREVRIRPRTQLDIESTFVHIALELKEPKVAREHVESFYETFGRLAELPETGRLISNDELDRDYWRVLVKNYWVYYTFDNVELTIWRVFHTRQDIANYALTDY